MSDTPDALSLADELEEAAGDYSQFGKRLGHAAAAQLRRLHAEVEKLTELCDELGRDKRAAERKLDRL